MGRKVFRLLVSVSDPGTRVPTCPFRLEQEVIVGGEIVHRYHVTQRDHVSAPHLLPKELRLIVALLSPLSSEVNQLPHFYHRDDPLLLNFFHWEQQAC